MRPIDGDALRADWLENGENEYVYDTNAVLDSIDNAPTLDVEPVVRCARCMHYRSGDGDSWCAHEYGLKGCVDPEDYCSYGEKGSRQLRQTEGNGQVETED